MAYAHFGGEDLARRCIVRQVYRFEFQIVAVAFRADTDRMNRHAERGQLRHALLAQRAAVFGAVANQDDRRQRCAGGSLQHTVQSISETALSPGGWHVLKSFHRHEPFCEAVQPQPEDFAQRRYDIGLQRRDRGLQTRSARFAVHHACRGIGDNGDDVLTIPYTLHLQCRPP